MKKNAIIEFEGLPRAGKTLQIELLIDFLINRKTNPLRQSRIKNKNKDSINKYLNQINFPVKNEKDVQKGIQLGVLYLDNHVIESRFSAKLNYDVLILDRYIQSSIAFTKPFYREFESTLELYEFDFFQPDVIFYLDVEPETSLRRACAKKNFPRLLNNSDYLKEVRKCYYEIIDNNKVYLISGGENPQQIHQRIIKIISKLF